MHHRPVGPGDAGPHAAHPEPHGHPAPHTHSIGGLAAHRPRQRRALAWSALLTVAMLAVEVAGGLWTGSLMLLSDAVHMLSHAVALAVSYLAIRVADRPCTPRSHYGLHRAEILASLFNGLGLIAFTGWIGFEAVQRFFSAEHVQGLEMTGIAALGLAVNLLTAWILLRSGAEDLNTQSALLHLFGDLFSSVVILAGGVALVLTGQTWIDPLLSLLVALVVLAWGIGLLRASIGILLELAPAGVEPHEVEDVLRRGAPEVRGVHDLHVWEITSGYVCLTAHVVVDDARVSEVERVRAELCSLLWRQFRVAHVTLQMEAAPPA
jgi:cobalt-zinc-cadmium efflux system protein